MKISKKKGLIIGGIVLFVLLIIFFTIYFIVPSFGDDKYGDRLDGESKYKISTEVINDVKDELSSMDGVTKVSYHKEGRLLNFTLTLDGSVDVKVAEGYTKVITDKISDKSKKYYDIQVLLNCSEETDGYPNIGYKHKSSDEFSWGNVGENNE